MSKQHGKDTVVILDGNDLSEFSTNVEFTKSADSHDVTTFGNDSHRKQGGLKDGTASIQGIYDTDETDGPAAVIEPIVGDVVAFEYWPEGILPSTLPHREGNVLVVSYAETSPVADMVTFQVDLEFDGDMVAS